MASSTARYSVKFRHAWITAQRRSVLALSRSSCPCVTGDGGMQAISTSWTGSKNVPLNAHSLITAFSPSSLPFFRLTWLDTALFSGHHIVTEFIDVTYQSRQQLGRVRSKQGRIDRSSTAARCAAQSATKFLPHCTEQGGGTFWAR